MTALVANLPIKRTMTGQIQLKEPTNQSEEETEGTDQKS
jgi:cell division topological specificity factor